MDRQPPQDDTRAQRRKLDAPDGATAPHQPLGLALFRPEMTDEEIERVIEHVWENRTRDELEKVPPSPNIAQP